MRAGRRPGPFWPQPCEASRHSRLWLASVASAIPYALVRRPSSAGPCMTRRCCARACCTSTACQWRTQRSKGEGGTSSSTSPTTYDSVFAPWLPGCFLGLPSPSNGAGVFVQAMANDRWKGGGIASWRGRGGVASHHRDHQQKRASDHGVWRTRRLAKLQSSHAICRLANRKGHRRCDTLVGTRDADGFVEKDHGLMVMSAPTVTTSLVLHTYYSSFPYGASRACNCFHPCLPRHLRLPLTK